MTDLVTPIAVVCATCGGDPRASATCKMCGGAGIGVASPDGFLVWAEPVDDFSIAFRKLATRVTALFHLALFIVGVLTLVAFIYGVATRESIRDVTMVQFWTSGHWFVTVFWFGLLLDCFLVFRLIEFSKKEKNIPTWKMSAAQMAKTDAAGPKANHR